MVERNFDDTEGSRADESQSPAWVPEEHNSTENHTDLVQPTPNEFDPHRDDEQDRESREESDGLSFSDDEVNPFDSTDNTSDIIGNTPASDDPDLTQNDESDARVEPTGMPFYTEPHATEHDIPHDVLERREQPEENYQPRREYDLSRLDPSTPSEPDETRIDPLDPRDENPEETVVATTVGAGLAGAPGPVASLDEDDVESTTIRRQSLLNREEGVENAEVSASWRPRESPTEQEVDSAILDEATVVPDLPSHAAPRVWSFFLTLLAIPIAWYLLSDAAARLTLATGNPMVTGVINPAALIELGGGLIVAIILIALAARSSLGAIIFGFLTAVGGAFFLAVPKLTEQYLEPVNNWLISWNDFGANVAHHLMWTGYTGVIFISGLLLFVFGIVTKTARRAGRKEEEIRTQIERMAPGTLKKKGRRK
ncbi:MAG: hypothetical protein Q4P71_03190 [Actinomycetaceae bacterium]|nr:hypothetical protein [Actinomycetaceae bacterium]